MLCKKKFKLIENLHSVVANHWLFHKRRPQLQLDFSIEYHSKMAYKNVKPRDKEHLREMNNVTAPHLHGILRSDRYITETQIDEIRKTLNEKFGRTQLFIQEDLDEIVGWMDYCNKYVQWNNELYDYEHGRVVNINFNDVGYQDPDDLGDMIDEF